ncbi:MAG TPA: trigger factor, partial [Intrasporangium sp.]|nr:trigger factor [Intrasporangium sp.]
AQSLDKEGQIPTMVAEVARRKALASVLEKVSVKDTAGNVIDLNEAMPGTEVDLEGDSEDGEQEASPESPDSADSAQSPDSPDSADSADSPDSADAEDEKAQA